MKNHKHLTRLAFATILATSTAYDILTPQNDTFASTFSFPPPQILSAGINDSLAHNIAVALNFERSNWATPTSVASDPFYTHLPANASSTLPPAPSSNSNPAPTHPCTRSPPAQRYRESSTKPPP